MAEIPSETATAPPRQKRKGGGAKFVIVLLIILALVGVIVYLLSLINSKRFFLVPEGNQLVVKKGVFFLTGSEPYQGDDAQEAGLYAPIQLPEGFGTEPKEFDDLSELNHTFANILIQQAQKLVFSGKDAAYHRGQAYLDRLDRLKGLKPDQVKLIMALNADVDYIEAKRAYQGVEKTLERALKKFRQAETYGTGRFADAPEWIAKLENLLAIIRASKAGKLPAVVPQAGGPSPAPQPTADDGAAAGEPPQTAPPPEPAPADPDARDTSGDDPPAAPNSGGI
jgi:hypothetical protein